MPTVRPARHEELPALLDLVQSAYRGESSRAGWTTEADLLDGQRTDLEALEAAWPEILVAEDDGEVLGCCQLTARPGGAYFGMFAVRPQLQGRGVGSLLLTACEAQTADRGGAWVEMTVITARTELISYYERRGYVRTGEQRPFPATDPRFGLPKVDDLSFVVLRKPLG